MKHIAFHLTIACLLLASCTIQKRLHQQYRPTQTRRMVWVNLIPYMIAVGVAAALISIVESFKSWHM